jgi:RNA polymerase sigma factor (sigma-70 family)
VDNQTKNYRTDQQLVERTLLGDRDVFKLVIKNTEGLVSMIVFKMISNTGDRKDIAQDIYLKAFHSLPGFKFQSKLSTWIAQIAYHTCLHYLKKRKLILSGDTGDDSANALAPYSDQLLQGPDNDTERFIYKNELSAILQREIEQLPPVYKTLLTLFHYEELSYEEIARITGLPEGTLKSYLFRARRTLKEKLMVSYKKEEL